MLGTLEDVHGAGAPAGTSSFRQRAKRGGAMFGAGAVKDFKAFLTRGNVVDLAVGIVIGLAFGALVTAFVADIITPVIAAIFGSHDFSGLTFTINGSIFRYGDFINVLIAFLSIAAAVFFFVVRPYNAYMERAKAGQDPDAEAAKPEEVVLLGEIRDLLRNRA
jgi:large conductance mechanosensitive channel